MNLSIKDRLILRNQYQIMKMLDPDSEAHYGEFIEILECGYTLFYSEVASSVDSSEVSEGSCKFVLDILSIYRIVEDYKDRLSEGDEVSTHLHSTFRGFDGNNEAELMVFARFLFKQGKFKETSRHKGETDNFNNHMPTTHIYRAMVDKWKNLGGEYQLSKDQILEVLNAPNA